MIDICFLSNTVLRSLKLGTYFCHYILVWYNCLINYTSPYIYQQLREEKKRKKFECLHFNELINIYWALAVCPRVCWSIKKTKNKHPSSLCLSFSPGRGGHPASAVQGHWLSKGWGKKPDCGVCLVHCENNPAMASFKLWRKGDWTELKRKVCDGLAQSECLQHMVCPLHPPSFQSHLWASSTLYPLPHMHQSVCSPREAQIFLWTNEY